VNIQLGRIFGLLLVFLGVIFTLTATGMFRDAGFTLRLFTAGPALVLLGVAMLVFPGGDITARESRSKQKDPMVFFKQAPALHKAVWFGAILAGAVVSTTLL
jgi:hypothetical protein